MSFIFQTTKDFLTHTFRKHIRIYDVTSSTVKIYLHFYSLLLSSSPNQRVISLNNPLLRFCLSVPNNYLTRIYFSIIPQRTLQVLQITLLLSMDLISCAKIRDLTIACPSNVILYIKSGHCQFERVFSYFWP